MTKQRMRKVFDHFDGEAKVFDLGITKSVPRYGEMIDAITRMMLFPKNAHIRVADIGTGTGNVALYVKKAFPNCTIDCIDLSPNMLEQAKKKHRALKNVNYILADVSKYKFNGKYDAIVSSLALHHLEKDADKHKFHRKAFKALKKGGVFINADIITAPTKEMQDVNLKVWKDFVLRSSSPEFMKDRYKRYLAEDRPAQVFFLLDSLRKVGFKYADVFWKYYNFAVYGGMK